MGGRGGHGLPPRFSRMSGGAGSIVVHAQEGATPPRRAASLGDPTPPALAASRESPSRDSMPPGHGIVNCPKEEDSSGVRQRILASSTGGAPGFPSRHPTAGFGTGAASPARSGRRHTSAGARGRQLPCEGASWAARCESYPAWAACGIGEDEPAFPRPQRRKAVQSRQARHRGVAPPPCYKYLRVLQGLVTL